MNNPRKTLRLFFALWPTTKVRQSIVETFSRLPRQIKGRVIRPQNLHVTLHFVGQVTEPSKDCIHAAAQSVNAQTFQLNLDCFGHFPKAKIFWMGPQNVPAQLVHLHQKLGDAIADCGFKSETRPFSPHVTLMRKCSKPGIAQSDFSLPWRVEEFVLVESITCKEGVNYQVIEKYPLS
jgi:2'-5' RNA ligase